VAPVVSSPVARGSNGCRRSWLQEYLSSRPPVAPVPLSIIACGSSICCLWLQCILCPGLWPARSASGCCSRSSSICRRCLSCGSSAISSCCLFVAPVSVVCGSGSGSSLQYYRLSFMAPVLLALLFCLVAPVSRLVQYLLSSLIMVPVSVVSSLCLQYLSSVAPVSPVVHGSGISCRSWLRYLLSFAAPVAPVSVVRGFSLSVVCGSGISCGCRSWLLWL